MDDSVYFIVLFVVAMAGCIWWLFWAGKSRPEPTHPPISASTTPEQHH